MPDEGYTRDIDYAIKDLLFYLFLFVPSYTLDFTLYISYKTTFFNFFFIVKSFLNGFWSFLHQKKQKYLKIICLFQY